MNSVRKKDPDLKQKLSEKFVREIKLYFMYVLFLGLFFSAFVTYQKLILENYGISYLHYGFSWIEALILAKIILIGQSFKLGEKFSEKPLIYPTLYKTLVFSLFVLIFSILEEFVIGSIDGKNLAKIYQEFAQRGEDRILANVFMMFFVFAFFFAFLETARVLGKGKLFNLFLKRNVENNHQNSKKIRK